MTVVSFGRSDLVSSKDVQSYEGGYFVSPSVAGQVLTIEHSDPEELILVANEVIEARYKIIRFLEAWKDGVRLAPGLFNASLCDVDSALDVYSLRPNYDQALLDSLDNSLRMFVLAMWSFWGEGDDSLKVFGLGALAVDLSGIQRDIISRLIINFDGSLGG